MIADQSIRMAVSPLQYTLVYRQIQNSLNSVIEAYPELGRSGPPPVRVPASRLNKHRSASEGEDSPESHNASGSQPLWHTEKEKSVPFGSHKRQLPEAAAWNLTCIYTVPYWHVYGHLHTIAA